MCTQHLHDIHPTSFPLPLVPNPPGKNCSTLLFSDFVEEKREKEKHDIFACLR
jgi:hypothetical protein